MKKMRMCFPKEKTLSDGFKEYVLDCKARNLRDGTIHHYQESIKQIYKRIPPDTPISSLNQQTMQKFYIALRDDPNLNEVSMGTYARDLKTLMRFFMKCKYIPHFEIPLPKADKVLLAFISNGVQAKTATYVLSGTTAVALTSQKLIYAQKRAIVSDFIKMARYDNINDISSNADCLSVEIMIDSLKECMKFSVDRTGVDGIRNKALELIEQHRSRKNATQKDVPQSVVQVGAADEVKKFKELLDLGVISQEEFDAKKKQLLGL